jgi:hypothetical protein
MTACPGERKIGKKLKKLAKPSRVTPNLHKVQSETVPDRVRHALLASEADVKG